MSRLVIFDGNHLAYRCKYVFDLSNNGEDVSITYGVLSVFQSTVTEMEPDAVIFAWDGGIPEFRRKRLPEYKANRHEDRDPFEYEDMIRQMQELHRVALPLCGVLTVRFPKTEADDIIYHAAMMAHEHYDEVVVVTSDKDMLQTIRIPKTVVYEPIKKEFRDEAYMMEEFGVRASDFVHYRALQGDPSDNIAGVRGVGPKTAAKLFQEHGSLSAILNAASENKLSPKLSESISNFGLEGASRNVMVMNLHFDRTGSRHRLFQSQDLWRPAQTTFMKKYLMRNAFVSLMTPTFYKACKSLKLPLFTDQLRMPRVCQYKEPLE